MSDPAVSVATETARRLRQRMVAGLRETGWLSSDRVAGAFAAVPRELFIADLAAVRGLEAVYSNQALPAKVDVRGRWLSSSSQPSVMGVMLELLEPRPGERVLEIGAGTGYNAALLRELVGHKGRVTTIEIDRELAGRARAALRQSGRHARVVTGDGTRGFAAGAPFDRMIVTASVAQIPNAWIDQLRPGGRLVLPLRLNTDAVPQVIPAFERQGGLLRSVGMTWGGFMHLHDGNAAAPAIAPQLNASYVDADTGGSLVRLTGPVLGGLSARAKRCLLSHVLAGPRTRRLQGTLQTRFPSPPAPLLWLIARLPAARRIELHADGRVAVGIAARDGSAAVASFRVPRLGRSDPLPAHHHAARHHWWVEGYGETAPIGELTRMIDEWRALPIPSAGLHIDVRRSRREHADIHLGWEQSS